MRIGTISFTTLDNYGALLQAYALAKLLQTAAHDVRVIDYQMPTVKLRDWLHGLHLTYIPHAPYTVTTGALGLAVRSQRLDGFRQSFLPRTAPVWTDEDLGRVARQFDALITGADEVFRPDGLGNVFPPLFLNFADQRRQRLWAYAASSGGRLDLGLRDGVVARLLERFEGISVRDEETLRLVEGLTGRRVPLVLDPTLLWKFDELTLPPPPAGKYVLTYGYFRSPNTDRMVRETADRLGARVVSVGWASKYAQQNFTEADVLQWLSCFKHAQLVFTNCYHGLMFATLFQRDFLVFEADQVRPKLHDFINRFSLASRLVASGRGPASKQLAGMDHAGLQRRLEPYAAASRDYLQVVSQPASHDAPAASGALASWEVNNPPAPLVLPAEPSEQIRKTGTHAVHILWEAVFSALTCPPLTRQALEHWMETLTGILMLGGVVGLHIVSNAHLIFLPLYLVPCAWFAVKVNARLALVSTLVAAVSGPLVQHHADSDFSSWWVVVWNMGMRFVTIHFVVALWARFYRGSRSRAREYWGLLFGEFRRYWPVVLFGFASSVALAFVQLNVCPHLMFIPMYMLVCMVVSLAAGRNWASILAVFVSFASAIIQAMGDSDYRDPTVFIWNTLMRLILLQGMVYLLSAMSNRRWLGRAAVK